MHKLNKKRFFLISFVSTLLLHHVSFATLPSLFLENQIGDQYPWFAEITYPFALNERHHVYIDAAGAYSFIKSNSNIQLGLLYRHLLKSDESLGGYLYTAYNRSPFSQVFWTLNPGLEFMHQQWQVNFNGYIPISARIKNSGPTQLASQFGLDDYLYFQGHNEFDQLLQPSNSVGPGTDLIASYRINRLYNMSVSLGSYYFHFPNPVIDSQSHILGVTTGISTPNLHNFTFKLAYNHDPLQKSVVTLAIKFHVDNPSSSTNPNWLDKPVQHNIATLGQANSIPIENGWVTTGKSVVIQDNIWFFTPNSGAPHLSLSEDSVQLSDCTYEHPCSNLNTITTFAIAKTNLQAQFKDPPSLFLAPGQYTFPDQELLLAGNESLIGRSQNYINEAQGSERPTLVVNQLSISGEDGNQNNTLANLQLINAGGTIGNAIFIANTENIMLDNLKIGVMDPSHLSTNYERGLLLQSAGNVTLSNSTMDINNFLQKTDGVALGIEMAGLQKFTITNSQINVQSIDSLQPTIGLVLLENGSYININHSQLNLSTDFTGDSPSTTNFAIGILGQPGVTTSIALNQSQLSTHITGGNYHANNIEVSGNTTVQVIDSTLSTSMTSKGNTEGSFNLSFAGSSEITLMNSSLYAYCESTNGKGSATNVNMLDGSKAHFSNSKVTSNGQAAAVSGNTNITASDDSSVDIYQSLLSTSFSGGAAPAGVEPSGAISIWTLGHSTVTVNESDIRSLSLNDVTLADIIQSEDFSQVNVSNSHLMMSQTYGNMTPNDESAAMIVGSNAKVLIKNSQIYGELSGISPHTFNFIYAFGSGSISIENTAILAKNTSTSESGQQQTIGAYATGQGALITLINSPLYLIGQYPIDAVTVDGGQVIITP